MTTGPEKRRWRRKSHTENKGVVNTHENKKKNKKCS